MLLEGHSVQRVKLASGTSLSKRLPNDMSISDRHRDRHRHQDPYPLLYLEVRRAG